MITFQRLLLAYLLLCLTFNIKAQMYSSGNCHVNVFSPLNANQMNDAKRAVVRYTITIDKPGGVTKQQTCTGTFINQKVNGIPKQCLLTAQHCVTDDNYVFNSGTIDLMFNFQSSNNNSESVPGSNGLPVNDTIRNDGRGGLATYRYRFRSQATRIYSDDDFALLEIATPIPEHFNVYYAGWNAQVLNPVAPYFGIHHAKGDLKRMNLTNGLTSINPFLVASQACTVITRAIDRVVRWFGRNSHVEKSCNILNAASPFVGVNSWLYGVTEGGSSGSGLFSTNQRIAGTDVFGLSNCSIFVNEAYSRFSYAYNTQPVRNYLNPNGEWIYTLPGRQPNCKPDLNLSGTAIKVLM